jgi:RHS repeat-associated protein
MQSPDGSTTSYGYNVLNHPTTLTNSWAGQFTFGYDNLSRRTSFARPNGVTTSYTYDVLSRLLSVLHKNSSQQVVDGATYVVDSEGNRTSKENHLVGTTETYAYDSSYQLTTVSGAGVSVENYLYDQIGNRTASHLSFSYATNTSNQLTATASANYTYDSNGNTLSKTEGADVTQYTWDYENRLTQVTLSNNSTVSFKYDPFGRRIQKSSAMGTTNYFYDRANIIEERDAVGAVVTRYVQGTGIDEPLAMWHSIATYYFEVDASGSVTSLSDASGIVAESYDYDAYGSITNSTSMLGNPFRFGGRELDDETGLYYLRARYFDSHVGRFLSADPIGLAGGINEYRYVGNNPATFVDSDGLSPKDWWNGVKRNANFASNWFWETDNFGNAKHIQFKGRDTLYYGPDTAETQDMMKSAGGVYMQLLYRYKYKCKGSPQNNNFRTLAGYLFTAWNPGLRYFKMVEPTSVGGTNQKPFPDRTAHCVSATTAKNSSLKSRRL